jgi:type III pantothenate kinase
MILVLDVGNSQIACGLYRDGEIVASFRHSSAIHTSSDEIGLFLRAALQVQGFEHTAVTHIAISSVVPHIMYALRSACTKYFNINPFVLTLKMKTGISLGRDKPVHTGADCLAGAIASVHHFPRQNLLIVDLGTANTVCAVTKKAEFLGGVIMPGMKMITEALERNTAKLPLVEIINPEGPITALATEAGIQKGLYYGTLDALSGVARRMGEECFGDEPYIVVGTGGFSHLFADENFFDHLMPDIVLEGTYLAWQMNQNAACA